MPAADSISASNTVDASAVTTCEEKLRGKKFDVLWNSAPSLDVQFEFLSDGTVVSNQTMFNGQPWRAVNANQFELSRKNGCSVLWQFKGITSNEAFRTDKQMYGLRLRHDMQ